MRLSRDLLIMLASFGDEEAFDILMLPYREDRSFYWHARNPYPGGGIWLGYEGSGNVRYAP